MRTRYQPYRYPSNDTIATLIGRLADMGVAAQTINSLLFEMTGVTMGGLRYLRVDQATRLHRELRHWVSALERARS